MSAILKDGQRRGTPDGGAQVFLQGRWRDHLSPEIRVWEAQQAANDHAISATIEAEMALLGCALFEPSVFAKVASVKPEHFADPVLGEIWRGVSGLSEGSPGSQIPALVAKLSGHPGFEELGGFRFLMDLVDRAPPPAAAPDLAAVVSDGWAKRSLAEACHAAALVALGEPDHTAFSAIADLRAELERIEQEGCGTDDGQVSAQDAGAELVAALDDEALNGRELGAMTGLRCIDRRLGGLRPGWLVVIGGRPSMGKSSLARVAAYGCARRNPGSQVLFYSLEMTRREISERALAALSYEAREGIAYTDMRGTTLAPDERATLRALQTRLPSNVRIDDRSLLSVEGVRRRIWAAKRKGPVAAVFIDYLQLMARPAAKGRNEASVISEMTSALKQIAKETEVCIVLLSQLSRAVESRDDKRPQLADLRESGGIEQDANAVLFPYREAYYVQRSEPKDPDSPEHDKWRTGLELVLRRMDVIAAKVRGGAIGTDRQTCFLEFDHVEDCE